MRRSRSFIHAVALALGLLGAAPTIAYADEPATDSSAKKREDEARLHFAAGVNLIRDPAGPRYEEAYVAFKRAYALVGSPKILGNIGLCAMKLERDAEAIDAYTRYLNEVPDITAEEREQLERDLSTLRATIATVTIETKPPGATVVDSRLAHQGDAITNVYGPIAARTQLGIRRGQHVMKARFAGGREVSWEADIKGGESHVFELPPVLQPSSSPQPERTPVRSEGRASRPVPASAYAAGGITLALGIGSVVTGLVALGAKSEFDGKNDGSDPRDAADVRSTGQTLNTVSDVLLVGAIVGAGVTAYLFLTRPEGARAASQRALAPFRF